MLKNCKIHGIGVNSDDYHAQNAERCTPEYAMSPSSLKLFQDCPSKYKAGYNPPDSDAKTFGNLVDSLFLTPSQFEHRYVVPPEKYIDIGMQCPICQSITDSKKCAKCKTDRKEVKIEKDWNFGAMFCSDWRDEQRGKEIISNTEYLNARAAFKTLRDDETIASFRDASDTQVLVKGEWHDEATGLIIPVQCLIDLAPRRGTEWANNLGDLKTTRNSGVKAFSRWSYQCLYHQQAGFDLDMFNAATGESRQSWCFLLVENYAPWQVGRRILRPESADPDRDETLLGLGRATYKRALKKYAQCLKSGLWPAHDEIDTFTEMVCEPWQNFEAASQMAEIQYDEALAEAEEKIDLIP